MTWKKITLTDAIVDDIALYLGREYLIPGRPEITTYPPRANTMDAWRIVTAVLSHPDAAELLAAEWKANAEAAAERAERAEDKLSDSVHVDEAARRVEAARELGWDDAADWVKQREAWTDEELRAANPHRPAPALPTGEGAVIIPADGHEHVEAVVYGHTYFANAAMLVNGNWRAAWGTSVGWCAPLSSMTPESVTPGTWRAV